MKISSPSFENNDNIPDEFTCKGQDKVPELNVEGMPAKTKTLALIMDDPDAPMGTWVHWIMWNIKPNRTISEASMTDGTSVGVNSWGRNDYGGPCPPSGKHRYFFKVYALDTALDLTNSAGKAELEKAMKGHLLAEAKIIGVYGK